MKKKLTIRLRGKLYRKFHHSRRRRFSCRARLSRSSSVCSELCNRARWTIRHRRTLQFLRWACRPSRWTREWTTEWLRSWRSCWRSAGRASSAGTAPKAVHCPGWTACKRCKASPCRRPSWRLSVSAPGWISKRSWISESDRDYGLIHLFTIIAMMWRNQTFTSFGYMKQSSVMTLSCSTREKETLSNGEKKAIKLSLSARHKKIT